MLIEKLKSMKNKNLIGIFIIVALISGYIVTFIYFSNEIYKNKEEQKNNEISILEEPSKDTEYKEIKVDIKGSVKKPGVYTLKENSRTNDAIIASGGLLKNANTRFINLSKIAKALNCSMDDFQIFRKFWIREKNIDCYENRDNIMSPTSRF